MFDRLLCATGLGYGGEFSEEGIEGALRLPGEKCRAG